MTNFARQNAYYLQWRKQKQEPTQRRMIVCRCTPTKNHPTYTCRIIVPVVRLNVLYYLRRFSFPRVLRFAMSRRFYDVPWVLIMGHFGKYHNTLCFCPKFCISFFCLFSLGTIEELETMLMQNLGEQTKSIMVFSEVANFISCWTDWHTWPRSHADSDVMPHKMN